MNINILEMVLGQIPEALYFSLFMIFTKQIKEKRAIFIFLMIIEYLIIQKLIHFNVWLHIIYTAFVFLILKVLYKEKAQVTDIFTFTISSILIILIDIFLMFIAKIFIDNYYVLFVIERILMFGILFLLKNKLPKLQNIYKKLWNRNDKEKKKIKSTTFRCINIIIFNLTFYIINILMLYCLYRNTI